MEKKNQTLEERVVELEQDKQLLYERVMQLEEEADANKREYKILIFLILKN